MTDDDMADAKMKLDTIKECLEELLDTVPVQLSNQVKILHRLIISVRTHLEHSERHQRQALNDMVLLNETLNSVRQSSYHISDAVQRLNLVAALLKELDITVTEIDALLEQSA